MSMTVRELVVALKTCDSDAEVLVSIDEEGNTFWSLDANFGEGTLEHERKGLHAALILYPLQDGDWDVPEADD